MPAPYRKKLIEVGLPLAAINAESAREKSIRHGHPSTLHLWWARRPLAACRAVLFASLVDDPDSDPHYLKPNGTVDEEAAGIKRADLFNLIEELVMWENSNSPQVIRTARAEIARCVASRLIETGGLKKDTKIFGKTTAYDLVKRGHCRPIATGLDKKVGRVRFSFDVSELPPEEAVNAFLAEHAPPVLDPFCGGGSIPLEAQRLGLRAYASDLNPVPVLINKALIEIPSKFAGRPPVNPEWRGEGSATKGRGKKQGSLIKKEWPGATGLADDVRYYGQWMRDEAEKRIGHLYPKVEVTTDMAKDRPDLEPYVGQKLSVIAWLWARTVSSPNPAARGAHVPLVRTFLLSVKKGKEAYARPIIDRSRNSYRFDVTAGTPPDGFDAKRGTVARTGATCVLSGSPIPLEYIRTEGKAGRIGVRLMAIVAEGSRGRVYLPPIDSHIEVAESAHPINYPETYLPKQALSFRVMLYGMDQHFKLFSPRQLVALTTLSDLVQVTREKIQDDVVARASDLRTLADGDSGAVTNAEAISTYLALGVNKTADYNSTLVSWINQRDQARSTFSKQALPMIWDYCEVNPFVGAAGDITVSLNGISRVLETSPCGVAGATRQLDATAAIGDCNCPLISTDPPYYDNIGYADLSDFFYIWLRRSLSSVYPSLFSTLLTPKAEELIASPFRHNGSKEKAQAFFEKGLGSAFGRMRSVQHGEFPLTVYYAFKQSESDDDETDDDFPEIGASTASTGWETMLSGLVSSGFSITGTWPIRTERGSRSVGIGTNALASSIVLVCRPRPDDAPLATRKEFITTLRRELPDALRNLQRGSIAPVDLAQASIGPGMAVFTRYAKVMESDGSPMTVRTALGLINQALDEVLAEQEGEFDGDSRWALAWFEQFGMEAGPFGDAETLSKAKNTAINGLVEGGVIKARAGKVQLIKRDELPEDWNPATDKRLTVWEIAQQLIRTQQQAGEVAAAALMHKLGGMAETARDLAYRLYSICERKKWADEALAYNGLVIAWPELTKLALAERSKTKDTQQEMF